MDNGGVSMISVIVTLLNGNTEIRWTDGKNIGREYYQDLSSTEQSYLDNMYQEQSEYKCLKVLTWEDYINKYDASINNLMVNSTWKTTIFLGVSV